VPQAVATALHAREEPGQTLTEVVAQWLGPRRCLLALDNCEHLAEACARLTSALLQDCPNLQVLATSRQALRLTGEMTYRVPSLALPPVVDHSSVVEGSGAQPARTINHEPSTLNQYDAVRLFVERAQEARAEFALTPDNAPAVAQVCQRLDGIPLALELAATCVNVLPVQQVAARLADRFRLLTGGSRAALPRQQTLR